MIITFDLIGHNNILFGQFLPDDGALDGGGHTAGKSLCR